MEENWKTIRIPLIALIVGAVLGVLLLQDGGRPVWENPTETPTFTPTPTPTNTPTPTPTNTLIPARVILSGIRTLGWLVTVQQELTVVNLEVRDPASLGCTYSAKHVGTGAIEAGIDLMSIAEGSIQRNLFGYPEKVIAPAPVISSCRIEEFYQYDRRGGWTPTCFGNYWDEMKEIGRHLAMETFVDEALNDGILEKAERQASLVLKAHIQDLIGGQVEIEFEAAPEEPVIPDSCQINRPENWIPHDENNKRDWKRTN